MVSSRRKPSGRDEADLVLTPGWGKLAKVTFTGLLFVGAGLFILKTGGPWYVGGLVIASGGLGIAIIAVNHLPGASFLRLEDDGFRYASLFRQHFIPWANITQFVVARIANRTLVGWNYIVPKSRLTGFNQTHAGCDAALPDTYGLKPKELADLLEDWRTRAGARPHS